MGIVTQREGSSTAVWVTIRSIRSLSNRFIWRNRPRVCKTRVSCLSRQDRLWARRRQSCSRRTMDAKSWPRSWRAAARMSTSRRRQFLSSLTARVWTRPRWTRARIKWWTQRNTCWIIIILVSFCWEFVDNSGLNDDFWCLWFKVNSTYLNLNETSPKKSYITNEVWIDLIIF